VKAQSDQLWVSKVSADYADFRRLLMTVELKAKRAESSRLNAQGKKLKRG